jgi:hypothetical protein
MRHRCLTRLEQDQNGPRITIPRHGALTAVQHRGQSQFMHWLVSASTPDTTSLTLHSQLHPLSAFTFVSLAYRSAVLWSCFHSLTQFLPILLVDCLSSVVALIR